MHFLSGHVPNWSLPSLSQNLWTKEATWPVLFANLCPFFTPTHAHAQQGVKWSSLSFIHSVGKKILRWRELDPSKTSEHIRSFEHSPILLVCTCYLDDLLPLTVISAVFLLPDPFWQPFYLWSWVTPTTYMSHVHLHSRPCPAIITLHI